MTDAAFRDELFYRSNFYPSPLIYEDQSFLTSEHAYVWSKCIEPADQMEVIMAPSPGAVKRLGRRLTVRPDWDAIKLDVMRRVVWAKFTQHADIAQLLVESTDEIVEHNTWRDRFWGRYQGVGENWLGRILEETRTKLAEGPTFPLCVWAGEVQLGQRALADRLRVSPATVDLYRTNRSQPHPLMEATMLNLMPPMPGLRR